MKTRTIVLGGVGIAVLGIGTYKLLTKIPSPPELPELVYFDTYILWEMFGKTLWHHTWLKLSEDAVGVVPAGTEEHPIRVARISTYIGATEQIGLVPTQLDIYQGEVPINSWSDTMALQWYVGPQQFRGSTDWPIQGEAGTAPGQYQLVATAIVREQTITRIYNYIVEQEE